MFPYDPLVHGDQHTRSVGTFCSFSRRKQNADMDVKFLSGRFKIANVRVIEKAEEYVRLLRMKFARASTWSHVP